MKVKELIELLSKENPENNAHLLIRYPGKDEDGEACKMTKPVKIHKVTSHEMLDSTTFICAEILNFEDGF